MFKHPHCGGQHETVGQARHCEAANTPEVAAGARAIRESQTPDEVWPWATPAKAERPAPVKLQDRPRTKGDLNKRNDVTPLGYAYAKALKAGTTPAPVTEPEFIAPPVVQQPSCSGRNSGFRGYPATEAQMRFITLLLEERDWQNAISPDTGNGEAISLIGNGEIINKHEASGLISALKDLPKAQDLSTPDTPNHKPNQPWKTLAEQVPAGNYCVTDSEGKRHFYRVSVNDKGFYRVQERASETLHFVALKGYAGILQSIVDEGIEKARLAYSTHMKRCWKCGLKLTDNTGNPYYSQGLGPDCGGK